MAYKIYQKLKSGMAALGLIDTTDIDDQTLNKKQSELNALFNQGKNAEGEQVGKTYTAGEGINISSGDEISLAQASTSSIGGFVASAAGSGTSFFVSVEPFTRKASVAIPTASASGNGLLSSTDYTKLGIRTATMDFGVNETSMTMVNMEGAATIDRVVTLNVSSLTITPQNGSSVTVNLTNGKAENLNISIPADGGVVADILRASTGNAVVAIKYKID